MKQALQTQQPLTQLDPQQQLNDFQHGYHIGAQAASMELRHGSAPHTPETIFTFIQTRLDPEHIQRQRDPMKQPIPLPYHAGFVSGYLATLYVPQQEVNA